jgi:hypothetical protein
MRKAPLRKGIGSTASMHYYLAGPMAGIEDHNFPYFEKAATRLRGQGYDVLSPHEVDHGETPEERGSKPYAEYLKADFRILLACDGIILLPGWMKSRGATAELNLALTVDMSIWYYSLTMSYPYELP